jgi:arabinose-5-phosphate isomerase
MCADKNSSDSQLIDSEAIVGEAREVFEMELSALRGVQSRLDSAFSKTVQIILNSSGKVVFSGVGKSGLVAQKIASSLCSTGTPAVFISGSGATHGDLGVCSPGDPTVLISNSGATIELLNMIPTLRHLGSPIIAIVGKKSSPLAEAADVILDAEVPREADHLNLVPTSSATAALVLGHALIAVLMKARGFTREQFALYHPAGLLGRNLSLRVADIMYSGGNLPTVEIDASVKDIIVEISDKKLGAACVINQQQQLCGLITDGDIRRMLRTHEDIRPLTALSIMTTKPVTVEPDKLLGEAIKIMEDRPSQISILPVVNSDGACLGLIRLHDILRSGLV